MAKLSSLGRNDAWQSPQQLLSQRLSEVQAGERDAAVVLTRKAEGVWTLDVAGCTYADTAFALMYANAVFAQDL